MHKEILRSPRMAPAIQTRKPPIIIPPRISPRQAPATLIFIHGYNFFASDFNHDPPNNYSVAYHIHLSPALKHLKIVIPEGLPNRHEGMGKHVWYNIGTPIPDPGNPDEAWDVVEYGAGGRDEDDMNVSLDYFESLVEEEVLLGTPANRIVFMGDSQGATILSLFILTRKMAANLAAVIAYAGFPPTPMKSIYRMQRENGLEGPWSKETTFFMLHGKDDVFVPLPIFHEWRSRLEDFQSAGQGIAKMEWKLVDGMRHTLITVLWPHIRRILETVVPQVELEDKVKL